MSSAEQAKWRLPPVPEKIFGCVGNNPTGTGVYCGFASAICHERGPRPRPEYQDLAARKETIVMESGELEGEVLSFIFENIDSVPHLEGLLLIWQSGSSEWSSDQLASRIYVSPQRASIILEDLRRRGFVDRKSEEAAAYTFATQWDTQAHMMPRLAYAYRTNLVRITTMIHSKGSASVREFARAFQIKKDI